MNTALQTFSFQSHQLTVITDEHGASWFIAMEVAEILEYSDANKMTSKLDEDEVQNRQIGGFGNRGVNIINESGLWSSVLRSTKPEAKTVKKWLTSEVLPAIHKTGSYIAPNAQDTAYLEELKNHFETQKQLVDAQQAQIAYTQRTCEERIAQAELTCEQRIAQIQAEAKEQVSHFKVEAMKLGFEVKRWQADAAAWERSFERMERSKYPVEEDERLQILLSLVHFDRSVREVAGLHYRSLEAIRKVRKTYNQETDYPKMLEKAYGKKPVEPAVEVDGVYYNAN